MFLEFLSDFYFASKPISKPLGSQMTHASSPEFQQKTYQLPQVSMTHTFRFGAEAQV
jgi:ferritin-like metal-binding protein YciE